MENKFYKMSAKETAEHFQTDTEAGLSAEEAAERLRRNGPNAFEKAKHKSLWVKFLNQFKSFMIIVLLAAAAVSGVVGTLKARGITGTDVSKEAARTMTFATLAFSQMTMIFSIRAQSHSAFRACSVTAIFGEPCCLSSR